MKKPNCTRDREKLRKDLKDSTLKYQDEVVFLTQEIANLNEVGHQFRQYKMITKKIRRIGETFCSLSKITLSENEDCLCVFNTLAIRMISGILK